MVAYGMAAACCNVTPVPPPPNICETMPESSPQSVLLSELQALTIRPQAAETTMRRKPIVLRCSGRYDVIDVLVDLAVTCSLRLVIQGIVVQQPLAAISGQWAEVQIRGGLRVYRQYPFQRDSEDDAFVEAALTEFGEWNIGEGGERADLDSGREVP